jgi:general stress protein YciG
MGNQDKRGFASMDDDEQREIARKGGEAVSKDREHMAEIGRKGGEASRGGDGGNQSGGNRGGGGGNQGGGNRGGGGNS